MVSNFLSDIDIDSDFNAKLETVFLLDHLVLSLTIIYQAL